MGWPPHSVASQIQDGYFTTSDHVKLHYLEAGQGLTLLFITGWLLPADIWEPQLVELSKDYHVVALDTRSQGESDITSQGDEPLRQAKDIQELMDHLQLDSVVLVGWSQGGFQVLAYMGEFGTERLYAAALVDSPLAPASILSGGALQARFLEQFKTNRVSATRGFVWSLFKTPPPGDFLKKLNQSAIRTPTDIALALMNNYFPGDPWQPSISTMRQIPLLYAVTPKYSFQSSYLTQVCPQARVEIFENTGHALFVDDPDRFNTLMRNFLLQASRYPPGLPESKRKKANTSYLASQTDSSNGVPTLSNH
jgi:microsomal epoxide hydrolase